VRDDAVGAVGAADDQSELADAHHRRRGLPDQHAFRLRGRQCAVPAVVAGRGGRCRFLSAARRQRCGGGVVTAATATLRAPAGWPRTLAIGALLALLAFAIFGPLANLLLWAFAEKWYFP